MTKVRTGCGCRRCALKQGCVYAGGSVTALRELTRWATLCYTWATT